MTTPDLDKLAERKAVAKRYRQRHARAISDQQRRWREDNRDKIAAHTALQSAIDAGVIERPDRCERCGRLCTPHGHHGDYSRKLDVEWVCRKCHAAIHGTPTADPTAMARGEHNHFHKLKRDEVLKIRALCANGESQSSVARRFGITQGAVSFIVLRKTWAHV